MIDWAQRINEADHLVWEGASVQRPDRRYRVEALQRRRGGGWKFSGSQCVTRWQRIREDQIVADPLGKNANDFFESILDASLKA
jgi:hypothetical protein